MNSRIFLIDFENVHGDGITGVDSLTENDEVVVFYSNNADTITFEIMHKLMFCKAKICYYKIKRGGRNALDFQMSSYLGYLVNACDVSTVDFFLISKDSGFDFVIDFWESGNINVKPKIKRFFSIRGAIGLGQLKKSPEISTPKTVSTITTPAPPVTPVIAPPPVVKTTAPAVEPIATVAEPVTPIIEPIIEIVEIVETVETIETADTTEATAELAELAALDVDESEIEKLISEAKSSHGLYISTVKHFGQKKGVEIYRNIKSRFYAPKKS